MPLRPTGGDSAQLADEVRELEEEIRRAEKEREEEERKSRERLQEIQQKRQLLVAQKTKAKSELAIVQQTIALNDKDVASAAEKAPELRKTLRMKMRGLSQVSDAAATALHEGEKVVAQLRAELVKGGQVPTVFDEALHKMDEVPDSASVIIREVPHLATVSNSAPGTQLIGHIVKHQIVTTELQLKGFKNFDGPASFDTFATLILKKTVGDCSTASPADVTIKVAKTRVHPDTGYLEYVLNVEINCSESLSFAKQVSDQMQHSYSTNLLIDSFFATRDQWAILYSASSRFHLRSLMAMKCPR